MKAVNVELIKKVTDSSNIPQWMRRSMPAINWTIFFSSILLDALVIYLIAAFACGVEITW